MYSMECICTHLLIPHVMAYCCYDDEMIFSIFCSCICILFSIRKLHSERRVTRLIKKMEHTSEPVVDVVYQKNDSKINTIINTMKKPLIVIGLSFIIFHPYTSKLLAKIFPKIFNSNTFIASNLRLICLSLILGLVFLAINTIM